MLIISNRAIYITKGKKRNSVCRYSPTLHLQPTNNLLKSLLLKFATEKKRRYTLSTLRNFIKHREG